MNDPVLEDAAAPSSRWRMQVNPAVFYISAALIIAFALYGALFPKRAGSLFDAL
jgi:choline/glycine/proline betaine transport protein